MGRGIRVAVDVLALLARTGWGWGVKVSPMSSGSLVVGPSVLMARVGTVAVLARLTLIVGMNVMSLPAVLKPAP